MENKDLFVSLHALNELYTHRNTNFVLVCALLAHRGFKVFKTKKDHNKKEDEGFFILGVMLPDGLQITYHITNDLWAFCGFADEIEYNADFDGHNSSVVLKRLLIILDEF